MKDERDQKVIEAIEFVRSRLREQDLYKRIKTSEPQTRYAMIDPVLSALGWDIHDPNQVGIEEECSIVVDGSTGTMKADYVLKDNKSKPVVIVEAKRLGTSLGAEANRLQAGGYAWFKGTEMMVLTEGQHWEIYGKDEQGKMTAKLIDLLKEEPTNTKEQLLQLAVEKWKNQESSEEDNK